MERSHLYGVIKKEIIRTLRRLKSVSGSDYTRLAQREGFEPSVPLRGTHDFQSCSLGRSDISAYALLCATLSIINFYSSFVNLSGRCFTDNIVKIPIITPAATLNAHTNGSCTYSDGDSSTSTATLVRAMLLQIAPSTLTETRLTFG